MDSKTLDELIDKTIELLKEREADWDTIEAVISVLQTEEHFKKMIDILKETKHPSKTFLLGMTILIADGDI